MNAKTVFLGSALLASWVPAASWSQTGTKASATLDEITVTARRREESLLDVPVAVTALSAEQIQEQGVRDLTDLSGVVPGFFFDDFSSARNDRGYRLFRFRGLVLPNFDGTSSGASLFIDGAPVIGGSLEGVTDIERIEFLKGPQSVHFGRATLSGAVNVITRDPGNEWDGRVGADVGEFGTLELTGSVEGPLMRDRLAFRLSARQYETDGQYRNAAAAGGRLGARETQSVALTLRATPIDALAIKFYGSLSEDDDGPGATAGFLQPQMTCDPSGTNGRNVYICGEVPSFPTELASFNTVADQRIQDLFLTGRENLSIYDDRFLDGYGLARETEQAHLSIDYEFASGMTLRALSAFHDIRWAALSDGDLRDTTTRPNPAFGVVPNVRPYVDWVSLNETSYEDLSHELRLNSSEDQRLRWTVGASYLEQEVISFNLPFDTPFGPSYFGSSGVNEAETVAGFAGAYFDVTEKVTLSAEGRYQEDRKTFRPNIAARPEPTGETLRGDFSSFSPRVTVDYKPAENMTWYAGWARGYRPGGFNAELRSLDPASIALVIAQTGAGITFDEEMLDQYDIGFKARLLGGRASVDVSVYYGELQDQQVSQIATIPNPLVPGTLRPVGATSAVGESEIRGIEFEGAWQATDELLLELSAALNETEIKFFGICAICTQLGRPDPSGNQFAGVPEKTGSFALTYRRALTSTYDWYVRPDYRYQDSIYADPANVARTGDVHRVNLRLGAANDSLTVEGYVTNLFDDDTLMFVARGADFLALGPHSLIAPLPERRQLGMRLTYTF